MSEETSAQAMRRIADRISETLDSVALQGLDPDIRRFIGKLSADLRQLGYALDRRSANAGDAPRGLVVPFLPKERGE